MARRRTFPGSIFVDKKANKIYIKFKGKKMSTGLSPTREGFKFAEMKLEKLWRDYNDLKIKSYNNQRVQEAFRSFLATKLNRYPQTIKNYEFAYKSIISGNYCLDEDEIEKDVQRYVRNTHHSPVTININLRTLQVFINYCIKKGWIRHLNIRSDYKQKEKESQNLYYNDEEIRLLINHFNQFDREFAIMIDFMVSTGARLVDCLTLTWDQVKKESIVWYNKITKKSEERPVSKYALSLLDELRHNNKPFRWLNSSKSSLIRRLNKAMQEVGIRKQNRGFQEFRVTFRMKLLERRLPLEYVMYLMRHSSATVTLDHYTNYQTTEIKKILDADE